MSVSAAEISGTFQLQNELNEYVSGVDLQRIMREVNKIYDKIYAACGRSFVPVFEILRDTKMITILFKDEEKNIQTEVELTRAATGKNMYQLAHSRWDLVPKQAMLDISGNRVEFELRKIHGYFTQPAVAGLRKHTRSTSKHPGTHGVYTFDLLFTETGITVSKKYRGSIFMTIQLYKERDDLNND